MFIPIQCEYYALEGLSQLLKNIELIRGHLNPTLHVSTILLTMYDGRTRLSAQVADEVRDPLPRPGAAHERAALGAHLRGAQPRPDRDDLRPQLAAARSSYLEAARELADRGAATPTTRPRPRSKRERAR